MPKTVYVIKFLNLRKYKTFIWSQHDIVLFTKSPNNFSSEMYRNLNTCESYFIL